MGIFIVEEMYRTGEIRLEDDKDLGLTQPINRCLQMIKADRSKQIHSFFLRFSKLFGSAALGCGCPVPALGALSRSWLTQSSQGVQVPGAWAQQLRASREPPEQVQVQCLG